MSEELAVRCAKAECRVMDLKADLLARDKQLFESNRAIALLEAKLAALTPPVEPAALVSMLRGKIAEKDEQMKRAAKSLAAIYRKTEKFHSGALWTVKRDAAEGIKALAPSQEGNRADR